jgi:crotonobetainyl-CoA:carnitine CoA-transferase CaiB-like acyl-CoA transferase
MMHPSTLPLEGFKAIKLAQNLVGPYASQILATLGAAVMKME